jgi:hypothetical protein
MRHYLTVQKRPFRITRIDLKGSEALLLLPPLSLSVLFGPNPLAALEFVLGMVAGMCTLAWLLKNRPDLFGRNHKWPSI